MMKKIILFLLLPAILFCQIPNTINYQGKLNDNSGNPVTDGDYSVVFSLYDVSTNGTALWSENRTITTSSGFFNIVLGENSPINIDMEEQLWLNVNVEGSDLTPRTKLSSSMTALNSKLIENTNSAGNSVVSSLNSSSGGVNVEKLSNGDITNVEFDYLDGLESNIQTQIDNLQPTLPDQAGNDGKYLSTDGTNLSWSEVEGGGGSSTSVELFTINSDVLVDTDQYIDLVSADLEANSSYKFRGVIGLVRLGSGSAIKLKMDYSSTNHLNYMSLDYTALGVNGETSKYNLNPTEDHIFEAYIRTTGAGTYTMQISKSNTNDDDSKVKSGSKFILTKIN